LNGQLRHERELRALSRKDLADLSGVDEVTIYRLEQGRTLKARPSTVRKLASALNIEPAVLMSTQTRLI
jgi:transcriptional regulator with XRE-family HTH domain